MSTDDGFSLDIIDLAPYLNPQSSGDKEKVIKEVVDACSRQGFFQVKGTGVPLQTQEGMVQACRNLFSLPREEKQEMSMFKTVARRGYEASGDTHREGDKQDDAKEAFYIGRENPVLEMPGFHAPNVWPKLPEEEFRGPAWEYYGEVHKLGRTIWEILIQGLGHSPSIMEGYATRPIVSMKMIRYPPSSEAAEGQFGVGAHTDFGGVTILLQQPGREGLEVFHEGRQEWLGVPALEDVLVVNVGNMISQWSGRVYKSPLHRVINKSGAERISVALFWHGDVDATNPLNPNDPSRDTVGDLLVKRFRKQFVLPDKVDIKPKSAPPVPVADIKAES